MKSSHLGTVLQVRVPDRTAQDLKALASAHDASRNSLLLGLFKHFTEEWAAHQISEVRKRTDFNQLLAADIRVSAYHADQLGHLFENIKLVS